MGSIEDIVKTIDASLLKSGKDYLTLAQCNQLLIAANLLTVKEQSTQNFKKLLENNLIPHAFKTETIPRQWRIPLSPKGKKKFQANSKKSKPGNINKSNVVLLECPRCRSLEKAGNHCNNCGHYIIYPVSTQKSSKRQNSVNFQTIPTFFSKSKSSNESQLSDLQKKGLYMLIVFTIFAIILYFALNNSDSSSPSIAYISHDTYGATSKDSFDELFEFMQNNDSNGITTLLLRGDFEVLRSGTEVYKVGSGFGYVVVKLKDYPTKYWVVSQAVTN